MGHLQPVHRDRYHKDRSGGGGHKKSQIARARGRKAEVTAYMTPNTRRAQWTETRATTAEEVALFVRDMVFE